MKKSMLLGQTIKVRLFGLSKIPLLWWIRPVVEELSPDRCVVRIPLRRRTKNHLGSMYFGALCMGAEAAAGLTAINRISDYKLPLSFVFKEFQARFIKRAHADVSFVCTQGSELIGLIDEAMESGERTEGTVDVRAMVAGEEDPVARFFLTISLKKKTRSG